MKRTKRILIAALAGVALSFFASSSQAQYKPTGDDGITAAPKLRDRLDEYKKNHTPAPALAARTPMSCAKCTDFRFAIPDMQPRGLGARTLMAGGTPMQWVTSHNCLGCGTDWKIVGHGRAKQSVATHKCTDCGSENLACCNTTPGSKVPTKGMEQSKH